MDSPHEASVPQGVTARPDPVAAARAEARKRPHRGRWALWLLAAWTGFIGLSFVAAHLGGYRYIPAAQVPFRLSPEKGATAKEIARLKRQVAAGSPRGLYIAVDVVENRLYLRRGDETLREAVCSAGTGAILEDPKSGRKWVFDTPRGVRKVIEKRKDPVWTKPDWAFIEEGEPVPKSWRERVDPYTLGDYALYLGNGYMIHGTLYQRYLGRAVTHGCIRLGDEDLEAVYKAAPIGTPVLIY